MLNIGLEQRCPLAGTLYHTSRKNSGNDPHVLDFGTSMYAHCTLLSRNTFLIPIKKQAKRVLEHFSKGQMCPRTIQEIFWASEPFRKG
jgi:hypothetical protein